MAFPRRSLFHLLLAISFIYLAACGDSGPSGPDPDDAIASVTVSPNTATVDVGSTTQLAATVRNGRGESMTTAVTWASATPGVGTVNNTGLVTGVIEGTTSVSASAGGYSGSATVTVNDPFPPSAVSDVLATALSNTAVQVTWTDNSSNEDEFRVDREEVVIADEVGPSKVYTQIGTVGTNATTFPDTGLQPGASYNYRVRACNENGCSDPVADPTPVTTYTELMIGTTTLPTGWISEAYQQTLSATGGGGGVTWTISDGTLPSGIVLDVAGILGGIPDTPGTFAFTVQVVGGGQTVTQLLSLEIYDQVMVTTASPPNGVLGVGYNIGLAAFGGDGSYVWAQPAGDLPPGLAINGEGRITGVPTALGSYAFTVEVTSAGRTATGSLAINVYTFLSITAAATPQGTTGTPYSTTFQGAGGQPPYLWSVSAGNIPAGLGLAEDTGILSGTPAAGGTFPFTVQLASSDGQTATADLSLEVTFVFACTTVSEIPLTECQALEAVYNDTNGAGWDESTNWFTDFSPCGWFGVSCDQGSVGGLDLRGNGLTGTLPPELGDLSQLGSLHLHANDLTGSIPTSVGQLSNLTYLFLQGNDLTGSIPSELGNLSELKSLYLDSNNLDGPIPSELGNLTNLETLNLYRNALTGSIPPELGDMTGLRYLYLDDNQLTGTIPTALGNLAMLELLHMDRNLLIGSIPAELGDLSNLARLELNNNDLTGSIPPELGDLSNLTRVRLGYNQFTGSIPAEFGDIPTLVSLHIQGNQLLGPIPSELGELSNLESLYLGDNQLTGAIPPELGSLSALRYMFMGTNQLTGAIPPELGNLRNLTNLSLYSNQLDGAIPPELGGLSSVVILDLAFNQLTGAIPQELGGLSSLEGLYLRYNQLDSAVPLAVAQLGGHIQNVYGTARCEFLPGNTGLTIPDTQAFRDADLDGDGFICKVMVPPAPMIQPMILR